MTATLENAERALDALLRTAINDDLTTAAKRTTGIVAAPLSVTSFDRIPTQADVHLAALLSDPIGAACRQGVWRIGLHLFKTLGTTDAMREVAERVADLDPVQFGRRVTIIDHAWNGSGSFDDMWWA